jgi:hypothetical protein
MEAKHAADEQRRNRRLFMELKVGVAVVVRSLAFFFWRPQFEARTRNVSASGLELLSQRPLSTGADVKLWVQLPTRVWITLRGTVVRTRPDAATGAFLCHIRLSKHPKKSIQSWENIIFLSIRNFVE